MSKISTSDSAVIFDPCYSHRMLWSGIIHGETSNSLDHLMGVDFFKFLFGICSNGRSKMAFFL